MSVYLLSIIAVTEEVFYANIIKKVTFIKSTWSASGSGILL